MDPLSWIAIIGLIMILGFVGNYIFNKTQIPSIVWLLLSGLVIGYLFQIPQISVDYPGLLEGVSGLVAAIAIIIILFDGGINTDIYQLFRGAPRGLLLTLSSFLLSFFGTMILVVLLNQAGIINIQGDSIVVGGMLGAIVAGTSSPIVIPLAYKLKNLQDKTKMVASIESILTDPICIVVAFAIAYMVFELGEINLILGVGNVVKTFSVGIVLGLALGIVWLFIMNKVKKQEFSYILTLALVFLVYSITVFIVGTNEGGEGAGAVACMLFGLVLGNGKKILRMVKYKGRGFEMDEHTKEFHGLTSFVIRTFFFVYLGMIVSFQNINLIIIGVILVLVLLMLRYLAVYISTYNGNFEKDDKQTMVAMMPRGLAAAILAIKFGDMFVNRFMPDYPEFFKQISFVVILGTAIITTVGISYICHCENKKITKKTQENS